MKAIFIIYNQALTEKVHSMMDKLAVRGYTKFPTIMGRGSNDGDPRLGTHTWPEINSGILSVIDDELVDTLLEKIRKLDAINKEVGIRAFVWDIEKMA